MNQLIDGGVEKIDTVTRSLPISQITQDASLQSRVEIDLPTVQEYAEAMQNGAKFPHPDVFEIDGQFVLVDGYHRIKAAQRRKQVEIECIVHRGTMRDAILWSSGVNASHGLRRTNADKRHAVNRLLPDTEWGQWSNGQIAIVCNVSESLVRSLRSKRSEAPPQHRTYVDKHGITTKINTTHIGKYTAKDQKTVNITDDTHLGEPDIQKSAAIPDSMKPVYNENDIAKVIPDPVVINITSSHNPDKLKLSDEMPPNQIAEKMVQCLSESQRNFIQKMIKRGEAENNLDAIGIVIDWAREGVEGLR